ncbi:MAG: 1-deoxy-D-xylulose-5-phosphate synthase, partial [Bacteroidetes bacterium]|nr:1-deoxy-D-xylulose-5-phosphate synthase [Bacteroidota bacterium]
MKFEIMYIEEKSGIAALEANIGKVFLSKTGKTLEYKGRKLQSLKGQGYKANYYDIETGEQYWISNCRKDGNDGL